MLAQDEGTATRCLADATIAALADGVISEQERAAVEEHVVGCDACHALIAAVLRVQQVSRTPVRAELRRGSAIDRYAILRVLGMGAQGEVVEAYDPMLDRRVAIKYLADERATGLGTAVREARAMARLAHPNVVPIHDVGIDGERPFLVMERVEGVTLRAWLGERRRPWQVIVNALCQAGRGLAAVHRAGLVHGDFKPDNVLVTHDERILVGDFGLSADASSWGALTTPARGTPAYTAPEVRTGGRPTPVADQYAFCVTLQEALLGRMPSHKLAVPAARGRIPRAVRAVIARGLADDPTRRHASLDVLVERLEHILARRVAARWAAAIALAAACAFAWYALRRSPAALERAASARLEGVWDDARRAAVHDALAATGEPTAASSWQLIARELDRCARNWTAEYATTLGWHPLRSSAELQREDQMRACLEHRRDELRATVDLIVAGGAATIDRATEAVFALDAAPCPSDFTASVTGPRAASARERLTRAEVLHRLGRFAEEHALALEAQEDARAAGDAALAARALFRTGEALSGLRRFHEAATTLEETAWAAEAARQDFVVAGAWISLIYNAGYALGRRRDGRIYERHARAALARIGDPPGLASTLHHNVSMLHENDGRLREALEEERRAFRARERAFGPRDWRVARVLCNQAHLEAMLGDYQAAVDDVTRAIEMQDAQLGVDIPFRNRMLSRLSMAEKHLGRLDQATEHIEHAVRASAKADTFEAAWTLVEAGEVLHAAGRLADAEERLRRSLQMFDRHDWSREAWADARVTLADVRLSAGAVDEAVSLAQEARATIEGAGPPARLSSAWRLTSALVVLGRARAARGELRAAVDDLSRALAIAEGMLGADNIQTAFARARLGEALLAAGRRDEGTAAVAAALRALRAARADAPLRASVARAAGLPLAADEASLGRDRPL